SQGECWVESDREKKWTAPKPSASIPIIKLHGSVNWFQHDGEHRYWFALPYELSPTASDSSRPEKPNFSLETFKRQAQMRELLPEATFEGREIVPAIIPPMLGKASVAPTVAIQWNAAIEALKLARQVWVVGYSFPATDTFMKRLLSQGIQENPN